MNTNIRLCSIQLKKISDINFTENNSQQFYFNLVQFICTWHIDMYIQATILFGIRCAGGIGLTHLGVRVGWLVTFTVYMALHITEGETCSHTDSVQLIRCV